MARAAQQKVYADFRQGFVTVANPLAYPEGSLKDIVNFNINDNGTLSKRSGLRQESSKYRTDSNVADAMYSKGLKVFLWRNAGRTAGKDFLVVFKNKKVMLFKANSDGVDMSSPYREKSVIDITTNMGLAYESIQDADVTEGSGFLFFTHPKSRPVMISLGENDEIELADLNIRVRDLKLWRGYTDEETGFGENTLYPQHEYNLRNGGWPRLTTVSIKPDADDGIKRDQDPIGTTYLAIGKYPKISIPFYAGRAGGGNRVEEQNAFSAWQIENDYFGNSVIPRGKHIVNAETMVRTGYGATPLLIDGEEYTTLSKTYRWTGYPSTVAFYAGRVWYAGAQGYEETGDPAVYKKDNINVGSTLYFSQQLADEPAKAALCYQENDPTIEDINQLLATDGGTISIESLGKPYKLVVFGSYLIILSDQGVWAISGTEQDSFTATGYSVNKISNIRAVSRDAVLEAKSTVYFLSEDAIYSLGLDQVSGLPTVQDVSSSKIKDYYQKIPFKNKQRSKLSYDEGSRILYFFFEGAEEEDELSSLGFPVYKEVLVLNEDLGSYYKYALPNFDELSFATRLVGAVYYPRSLSQTVSEAITLDGVEVTLDGEPVTLDEEFFFADASSVLFVYHSFNEGADRQYNEVFTASFTDSSSFEDLGKPYSSYIEFGFDTAGDIMRDSLKAPVIISHMQRTEDGFEINPEDLYKQELILKNMSSCWLSYGWDWATNYGRPQQLYRFKRHYTPSGTDDTFEYGVDVITTRNRIRGKGHSLGVRLDSEEGKDCKILGVGILYTQAQRI